mmetsp:Transcript_34201/g.82670  ORF Transcript_34201/g.82670 Transcript_34201/m.82670 type:complete len:241 (-) Transcript_34201:574-1296(-)
MLPVHKMLKQPHDVPRTIPIRRVEQFQDPDLFLGRPLHHVVGPDHLDGHVFPLWCQRFLVDGLDHTREDPLPRRLRGDQVPVLDQFTDLGAIVPVSIIPILPRRPSHCYVRPLLLIQRLLLVQRLRIVVPEHVRRIVRGCLRLEDETIQVFTFLLLSLIFRLLLLRHIPAPGRDRVIVLNNQAVVIGPGGRGAVPGVVRRRRQGAGLLRLALGQNCRAAPLALLEHLVLVRLLFDRDFGV